MKRSTSILLPLLFLAGCGEAISNSEATACMQRAADSANGTLGLANMLLGPSQKIPAMQIKDTKVQECAKTGPGTHSCLVVYNLHFDGELSKFHRMTMGLDPDAKGNVASQAKWEFVKGDAGVQCRKLD